MMRFISKQQAKLITGLSPTHLKRLEDANRFPRSVKLGPHENSRRMYVEEEVVEWVTDRIAERDKTHSS